MSGGLTGAEADLLREVVSRRSSSSVRLVDALVVNDGPVTTLHDA
jgi:hypothetical protein